MANINLLPWREEQRKEKTRQFTSMMGFSVFLTIAVFLLIHVTISSQISHQQKRNKILQDEISRLDVALKEIEGLEETKEKLLSRMDIIQSLQQKRPQIVHLFDEIVRTVPEGIYLTGIKQSGTGININGIAESNGRVSAYMRNIDNSDWMATPKLSVIESKKGTLRSSEFMLTTSQSTPKTDEGEDG
jgi:type IV pilus assembly protein PilN